MKRWIALLLALVLSLSLLPVAGAQEPEREISEADYAQVDAMWEDLEQAELRANPAQRNKTEPVEESTAAAVAQAAQEHPLYKDGTLRWNGDGQFTFETTVGVTCGYSVRLRNLAMEGEEPGDNELIPVPEEEYCDRDVYVFQPYYGLDRSFTTQYQEEGERIALATGGTYRLYLREEASIDALARAMERGAVVIFDSHGETDYAKGEDYTSGAETSYVLLQTGGGLTTADYAADNGVYHAVNYGRYGSINYYAVDGTCIANHMQNPAQADILWMAICLSMATDGLHAPLMEQGIAMSYGYSQSVTFGGDYCWEECFWEEMCKGAMVKDAIAKMKESYGQWDYSPEIYAANNWLKDKYMCSTLQEALDNRAAFPIVVSAQDVYPGHGNVDAVQQVNSTLFLKELTVAVNDESLGSASREGNVITALPAADAYVEGYSLSPEDAAVLSREGDAFTVTELKEDCTLTVNFARRLPAEVAFCVPEGCQMENMTGFVGTELALTAPMGSPVADGENYSFLGWTESPVTDCLEAPAYVTDSFTPSQESTLLYALYSYQEGWYTYYTSSLRMKICYAENFADVDLDAWYHEAVDFVVEKGYLKGTAQDAFGPEGNLTRAMLVTVLYRMSGEEGTYSQPFADVPEGQWYSQAVAWAYETGVVTGISPNTFEPEAELSREQAAAMFYRYARHKGYATQISSDLSAFRDAESASSYAVQSLCWAVSHGIMQGEGNGILNPLGAATRAEIAQMIENWMG